jgi:hypothetical protein
MTSVGFELTIPALEEAKTVRDLDRAVTVIGTCSLHSAVSLYEVFGSWSDGTFKSLAWLVTEEWWFMDARNMYGFME